VNVAEEGYVALTFLLLRQITLKLLPDCLFKRYERDAFALTTAKPQVTATIRTPMRSHRLYA
jgi:hypothetical protein